MTKAELEKQHAAMARFLIVLCRNSDKFERRLRGAEKHYQRAMRLIKAAGYTYKPPVTYTSRQRVERFLQARKQERRLFGQGPKEARDVSGND